MPTIRRRRSSLNGRGGQHRSATATHRQATHLRRRRLMSSGEARAMGTDGCGAPSLLGVVGGVYRLSSCMPPRGVSTLFTFGDAAAGDGDCVAGGGCASVPPGSGPLDGQSLDGVSALISVAKPPGRNVTTDGVLCKAAVQSASLIRRGRTDAAQMHRRKCTGHKSPFRQKPPPHTTSPLPIHSQCRPLRPSTRCSRGRRAESWLRYARVPIHSRPPRARLTPRRPAATESHLRRAAPHDRRQERKGPGGESGPGPAARGLVPAVQASLLVLTRPRVPCARVYQAALFKSKITTLKDRKKVNGKRVWV